MAKQDTQAPQASAQAGADDTAAQLGALLHLLQNAPEDFKAQAREALGASGVVQRQKQLQNNSDAKRIAFTVGEILHPPGFEPKPSESLVASLGEQRAKAMVVERYNRNQNAHGATVSLTGRDAEEMKMGEGVQMPQPLNSPEELADMAVE